MKIQQLNKCTECTRQLKKKKQKKIGSHDSFCLKSQLPPTFLCMFWNIKDKCFICPKDKLTFDDPDTFRNHFRYCQTMTLSLLNNQQIQKPKMNSEELEALDMVYDDNYRKIICLKCLKIIGHDIVFHFKNSHQITITEDQVDRIKDSFNIVSGQIQSLNIPIVRIPIQDGFCCPQCRFSSPNECDIFDHMKAKNHPGIPMKCSIQCPRIGNKYFTIFVGSRVLRRT